MALTYSITTRPHSLGGPSGVFDVPKEKFRDNPYRGHGGLVTANVYASSISSSSSSTSSPSATSYLSTAVTGNNKTIPKGVNIPTSKSVYGPSTPGSSPTIGAPRPSNMIRPSISTNLGTSRVVGGLATPPNTPPSATSPPPPPNSNANFTGRPLSQRTGALLSQLFPNPEDARDAASRAQSISVESYQSIDGGAGLTMVPVIWDGFVLQSSPTISSSSSRSHGAPLGSKPITPPSPRSAFKGARRAAAQAEQMALAARAAAKPTKTLYMSVQNVLNGSVLYGDRIREMIVALLDLASEHLECDAVVMVLDRGVSASNGSGRGSQQQQKEFGEFLHSLMYVGGSVVTRPPFPIEPRFVLVGIEV